MKIATSFLIFIGVIFYRNTNAVRIRYDSFKVYQIVPKTAEEVNILRTFENNELFDFWSSIRMDNAPVDVMVAPVAQNTFEMYLEDRNINYEILIDDVEEKVQSETKLNSRVAEGSVSFTEFMRYDEITAYLRRLSLEYPNIVKTEVIGKSFEGRDINLIRISSGGSNKTTIFAEAAIHAREWIAPPVALYIINQLVENPNNTYLYQDVDWAIIPVANPDGYEYTHTNARLWRKTRSPGTICGGVDPNRNFDLHWNVIGASKWQCDQTYAGYEPFSELETQAIRDYTLSHKDNIKLYVAIHSRGQWLLYPWGHTYDEPDNSEELNSLGKLFTDALFAVNGTSYVVGSTANVLYFAAGTSIDWAKGVAGIDLSYTIELPGGGSYGFDIPADRIQSVVDETWEGFKALHGYVQDKFVN